MAEKCGDDEELMQAELDRLVKENITANYAILELCEQNGLKYEDVEDEIDDRLDIFISENFDGSSSDYTANRNAIGMSKRYDRYLTGLELLSEQLPAIYVSKDNVLTEEVDIIEYVKENFIRVHHLVIFNDEGDDPAANLAKITEAKNLLDSGKSIKTLIGQGYSEDFGDLDASGYYITRGTMIEDYENAAFALKVGEHSNVISTYSENNYGKIVSCYYVIQRFAMDDKYINENYISLKNDYYNSIINSDLEEINKSLEFIPNDKYESLDLTNLSKTQNPTLIVILSCIAVIITAAVITLVIIKQKYKKTNISYKNKLHGRKA